MYDLLKPTYLTQKSLITSLFLALGIKNIQQISYCISRVRIIVKDSSLLADDSVFLDTQVQGVIRKENSIHLIFGQQSAIIGEQLQLIIGLLQNPTILPLIFAIQGIKHIKNISIDSNIIHLPLQLSSDLKKISINTISNETTKITLVDNTIQITSTDDINDYAISLQYSVLHWELIQSIYIFDYIPIKYINKIEQINHDISILLSKPFHIIIENWLQLGLNIEQNNTDSLELVIKNCTIDLYTIFLKYFSFQKK